METWLCWNKANPLYWGASMKKIIIIISFTLFISSILIFAFNFTFQKYSYGMLMSNHQEINVLFNDNKSQDDFINK